MNNITPPVPVATFTDGSKIYALQSKTEIMDAQTKLVIPGNHNDVLMNDAYQIYAMHNEVNSIVLLLAIDKKSHTPTAFEPNIGLDTVTELPLLERVMTDADLIEHLLKNANSINMTSRIFALNKPEWARTNPNKIVSSETVMQFPDGAQILKCKMSKGKSYETTYSLIDNRGLAHVFITVANSKKDITINGNVHMYSTNGNTNAIKRTNAMHLREFVKTLNLKCECFSRSLGYEQGATEIYDIYNLPDILDFTGRQDIELIGADMSNVKKIKADNGAWLNLSHSTGLHNKSNIPDCVQIKMNACDITRIPNTVANKKRAPLNETLRNKFLSFFQKQK